MVLPEVLVVNLGDVAGTEFDAEWRQTPLAAAVRVVHVVSEAGERLGGPRRAHDHVWLVDVPVAGVTQVPQAPATDGSTIRVTMAIQDRELTYNKSLAKGPQGAVRGGNTSCFIVSAHAEKLASYSTNSVKGSYSTFQTETPPALLLRPILPSICTSRPCCGVLFVGGRRKSSSRSRGGRYDRNFSMQRNTSSRKGDIKRTIKQS